MDGLLYEMSTLKFRLTLVRLSPAEYLWASAAASA